MKGKNVLIIFIIMLLIGGGVILYLAKSGKTKQSSPTRNSLRTYTLITLIS